MEDDKLSLTDLISAETLQNVQDAFSAMTGMAALTTDADGIPVTRGSNFSDFCMKHVRESEDGHIRCEQCDKFGAEDSWKRGSSSSYYCHAGLIDYAAPILANGKMVGSFIGGQVLTEAPDRGHMYEIAWELGIDPQKLWEASQKIRILDKKKIDNAAQFLFTVANVLSDMAYSKYRMLQANQEIERANNMKSDFLANMSHEIRTPMNAVVGMAEMALREELSPTVREYIRQIKISNRALLTIINDILDFSKIESGKMDILPVEYEAMSIVNDVVNIVAERLKDKDVELILNISPDIPHLLLGDNIRIKQILLNLANNAAKFTQEGQVVVRMSHTKSDEDRALLHFSIEDTGIGIKQSDMQSIFESFQQVDSKRNRNIEGTGLGLAISRQLTELMGGAIRVRSLYGKGSIFSFDLPQEIVDEKPSCRVREPEHIHAIGLFANGYVRQNFMSDMDRFNVEHCEISSVEELKPAEGKRNFLFVEKELFSPELKQYIKENRELTAVLLLPFHADPEAHALKNLLVIRKPLYSMNEANIFNGEDLADIETDTDSANINFVAPTAKVLVVDDNAVNLVVTEGLLAPLKMKVETAAGGREAIDKISDTHYDIVFMDHMMPDLDGIETTHIIRRLHPEYDDVPIIALTANAMSGMREMFLREGMNDFVSKPIELKNLIKKVAVWLPKEKIEKTDQAILAESSEAEEKQIVVGDLDTKQAIQLLGGEELFWTVLKNYYRAIKQKADLIREHEENADWEAYTIEVHSLKSTSRQIGAIGLSEQAAELEQAGNVKNIALIRARTGELLDKYRSYVPVLAPFCQEEETAGERGEITAEELNGFFEELETAVEELDMDRMEAVCRAMREYRFDDRCQSFYERLTEAVENMAVDACTEIINDWKAALQ